MLGTNLATRPFYNERAVYLVLGLVALVGLAVLVAGVVRIVDLSTRNTELTARADRAERESAGLSAEAAEIQRSVDQDTLDEVAAAAREANLLIDQRVFSWTEFFNRIETTLPTDVMLTEVRPDIAPGSTAVTMGVRGRRLDAIDEFIDALAEAGAFDAVLNRESEITEDGMYRAVLTGLYVPVTAPAPEVDERDGAADDAADDTAPAAGSGPAGALGGAPS